MCNKQPNFVVKKSLTATLRAMPVGSTMIIKNKDFKYTTGRAVKYVLKKEGIELDVTEKGMIDEWKVTRVK